MASAIYPGTVTHRRMRPKRHRLRYPVFTLLIDLDELPELDRQARLFGYNRWAPMAFHDGDHGYADGAPLRPWAEDRMRDAELEPDGGPIRLLCYPRILGYVFNPLSVYFCYRRDGSLHAILYEVRNTHGERHTYVIPAPEPDAAVVKQSCDKRFFVSPFIGMAARYHFRVAPPGGKVNVVILQEDRDGLLLAASFNGARQPFTGSSVAACLRRFPLMTVKIIAAIHWEALKMALKGFRIHRHAAAESPIASSVGHTTPSPS